MVAAEGETAKHKVWVLGRYDAPSDSQSNSWGTLIERMCVAFNVPTGCDLAKKAR